MERAENAVFAVTRSSQINLPDDAGVFQALGNDSLPRTDRGLYANGQIASVTGNGQDISQSPWINFNDAPTLTDLGADGALRRIRFQTGSVVNRRRQNFSATSGQVYRRRTRLKINSDCSAYILLRMTSGIVGNAAVQVTASGVPTVAETFGGITISNLASQSLGDGVYDITYTFTMNQSGTVLRDIGATGQNTPYDITYHGDDVYLSSFLSDAWVSYGTPAPTLLASDIRAAQGTRPSNGQPEPFPGWETAGLDDAVAGKAVVNIDRLNASAARFIAGAGVDANNLWRLIFDTDNRFKLIVRKSGSDVLTLQSGVASSTGLYTVDARAKPGDYALTATGLSSATSASGETLPSGATTLRIGSNFALANPFNGWVEDLQILRAA
ncbi:MAG: hypothetical protein AB1647_14360 [Pseudomonadota bacterium]